MIQRAGLEICEGPQTRASRRGGRKWKAPGSCWGTPGPHCKQPVSRILSRTAIPLGLPLLAGSSNLPGGFRSPPACAAEDNPRGRAGPARIRSRSGRAANFLPIWSCSVWGLPCLRRYRRSGALLPHLFTLTFASCKARAVCSLWHWPSRGLDAAIPDVIRHTALRSSDFPLPAAREHRRQRPPGLPAVLMIPQAGGGSAFGNSALRDAVGEFQARSALVADIAVFRADVPPN